MSISLIYNGYKIYNYKIKSNLMNTQIKWHFLPELPKHDDDILIAMKYTEYVIQGYYNKNGRPKEKWQASHNICEEMVDGFCNDRSLSGPEFIYAWAEMPTLPPVPDDDLNESKKEVKHFLVIDKSGRNTKPIKLTEAEIRERFDFDELNQEIDEDEVEDDGIEEFLNSCYIGDIWESRTIEIKCDKII